jgi:hypothetical protein
LPSHVAREHAFSGTEMIGITSEAINKMEMKDFFIGLLMDEEE